MTATCTMEESPRKVEGKKQDMKEAPTVWFHLMKFKNRLNYR